MTYEFDAIIQTPKDKPGAFIIVPVDIKKEFGKGRLLVRANFDGEPYQGSIVSMSGMYVLGIQKTIQEKLGKKPGDRVHVTFQEDTAPRTVSIPTDLTEALQTAGLTSIFERLSYTHQKEYVQWINEAKKQDTRERRIKKTMQMIQQKTTSK